MSEIQHFCGTCGQRIKRIRFTAHCLNCGAAFIAGGGHPTKRAHSKYCSPRCRMAAMRKRKEAKE